MDKLKMQILAGVPITKANYENVTETKDSKNIASRAISSYIKSLDFKIDTSTSREYKAEFNSVASDFEDILMLVKAGKQNKAVKLFNELNTKYKKLFFDNVLSKNLDNIKSYFSTITEDYSHDNEELQGQSEMNDMDDNSIDIDNDQGGQSDDSEDTSDLVQCPFSDDVIMVRKIDFYDHIMDIMDNMDNQVGEVPGEETPGEDEFDINLGTLDGSSTLGTTTQMNMEAAVDATVWDKTDDKDENPSAYPTDKDKISLPKNIKSSLEKEIKKLQKSSEDLLVTDYNTAEFQNNVANAMIDVLNHLNTETEHGMKMAQVCITKYMSPIVQKFPSEVYDFILHGGYDTKLNTGNSLVSMFKEIKAGK